ncbi:MAG: cysteine desulfurase [Streptococcus sp.]|uniref:Aminotransferase class V-fold PLP-dependent enzyme n=1 Tax=Streptococcus parasanguinis TaxID=1318 RepID=A0A6L6LC82_STRPA|nr:MULTISPECIES: cysteine desulfurase family protein [Streptococcus]MBF1738734.1 cysteine desulfurase [Streptococcus sp.]MTR61993.1 aminotransferase class V-fold PLP-dependent enzyme [Streptococcus parasanguinis]MTR64393.1 aminotransferase class V-fold PLP-dependent enzyme [Streptococcus parasanguinis]MTR69011.1 aminotransferase class V-fold PLP-dependent enzyme [Streptococcus parasanguinis]MTS04580.1 aminotransferase class V-fold PLP-dependent enzyme [Streptococcus parasanguinis]
MIYFDNSATTKPYPEALATYTEVATRIWGNPSSLHNLGSQATRILEASRKQIAELIGKKAEEIYFTSGGTEGDNWILKGVAFEKAPYGKHIIVSDIEHPAIKESAAWLKTQGFEVDYAPVDARGFVKVDALASLLRPDTTLVSVMAVNNEIGSIQPIHDIAALLEDRPTISFHVDAVQALAKVATEVYLPERVDFATFSSHKFHGLRGVGFVYIKEGKKITPLLTGGGQEKEMRSTTENVAGIAATAKALRLAMENQEAFANKTQQMKEVIRKELANYPDVTIFSGEDHFAPHILTFGIKGVRGEVVVHAFEEFDIYISTTSACSSKAGKPAGTLIAMGVDKSIAQTAVRLSLDLENDMSQVEQFLTKFKLIYEQTRKVR